MSSTRESTQKVQVLAIGLEANDLLPLADLIIHCDVHYLASDLNLVMKSIPITPSVVLCGRAPKNSSLDELGQLVRFVYPTQPIYLVCMTRDQYDAKYLKDMGYTGVYLSPVDWVSVKKSMNDALASVNEDVKSYHPIKLLDLRAGMVLRFDTFVYLPVNNRYVLYSKTGDPFDQEKVKQLSGHKFSTLFIESSCLPEFYQDVATKIKNSHGTELVGATERRERLRSSVRDFFSRFFNASLHATEVSGLEMTAELRKIVTDSILLCETGDWFLPLLMWAGEPFDNYAHASNVALYASLFSARLGIGKPEELALAGLLHDCGLVNVPAETLNKPRSKWTDVDHQNYQRHPKLSLTFIRNRKLDLPPRVLEMILQHHESPNGKGYPRGLDEQKIYLDAQLLSIADQVDYLVSVEPGKVRLSPYQALLQLHRETTQGEESRVLNSEIIKRVIAIFPPETI